MTNEKLENVINELVQTVERLNSFIPMLINLRETKLKWSHDVANVDRLLLDRLTINAFCFARMAAEFSEAAGIPPHQFDVSALRFWGSVLERLSNTESEEKA
jgi:hypothetical protein